MKQIEDKKIGQIVVVVSDLEKTLDNYCKVFGLEKPPIQKVPKTKDLPVYYNGELTECEGRLCVLDFSGVIFEIMEPGPGKNVWREYLDQYGEGVFDIGFWVDDRKDCFHRFSEIGVMPKHVGFFEDGSYSILEAKKQLGMQVNIHCHTEDYGSVVENPPKFLSGINY